MPKLTFLVLTLSFSFLAPTQEAGKQKLIQDALLPLPEHLRESASASSMEVRRHRGAEANQRQVSYSVPRTY